MQYALALRSQFFFETCRQTENVNHEITQYIEQYATNMTYTNNKNATNEQLVTSMHYRYTDHAETTDAEFDDKYMQ